MSITDGVSAGAKRPLRANWAAWYENIRSL